MPESMEVVTGAPPLSPSTYETAGLEGVFGAPRDAAPDAWGRLVIDRVLGRTDNAAVEAGMLRLAAGCDIRVPGTLLDAADSPRTGRTGPICCYTLSPVARNSIGRVRPGWNGSGDALDAR